jgi:hypothetical protein
MKSSSSLRGIDQSDESPHLEVNQGRALVVRESAEEQDLCFKQYIESLSSFLEPGVDGTLFPFCGAVKNFVRRRTSTFAFARIGFFR